MNRHTRAQCRGVGGDLLTLAVFVLWMAVQVLAVVPALHEALHDDATWPGHECFLTEFASNHGVLPPATATVPHPPSGPMPNPSLERFAPVSAGFHQPHGPRPPPAFGPMAVLPGFARV